VVVKLLTLSGSFAKQSAPGQQQVGAQAGKVGVHQKILLLSPADGVNLGHFFDDPTIPLHRNEAEGLTA